MTLGEMTTTATIAVTVRYFAAARAAAGNDEETVRLRPGTTLAELVVRLGERDENQAKVLKRCSFLCDGIAVRDDSAALSDAQTVDVLPPFAGG
ncbi:MoaD/ThiS family protein [Mycolicibacterium celeriflavum]|uniref:Molybdopterin synthase sulfur carrier subunit n=1 Tax=Mycolicibacterium celeriflavum TaxID=1249101 RepID=A0A7I7RMG5_MYCCF|nr:MoaD/ThiS family protein [Mycolicibacterium celeriflavum]MCV7241113.1 MoaD/ThiS family protein [Mycolicibacterium celeriflavum]BBY45737.1 molybdopterin synthase sulfur carrier subunit [Mycolicibacterium celeriflavum]